jgi:hypothetical protein|tara:strand:+ start:102423 stop:103595 length:1173 start_codon:yes stop_codon:yes gene_type:complete
MTLWMNLLLRAPLKRLLSVPFVLRVPLALIFGVLVGAAAADELKLGFAEVPVADRSPDARSDALAQGLDQVLVRLVGSRHLDAIQGLQPVRNKPSQWAQQYSYGQDDQGAAILSTRFDVNGLLSGLQSAGVPVWGQTRPDVLVWMVIQRPGSGQMVDREMIDPAAQALRRGGQERGLPLLLPLMDGQDRAAVSVADIRGHFDNVVGKASERYQAPLRLSVVLYTGSQPQIRWRLFRGVELLDSGELTTADESEAVAAMIDRVADRMASAYVISAGGGEALTLNVQGVNTLKQWDALQGFVARLTGIEDVRLVQLDGSLARFNITFSGSVEQLQRLLALQPGLAPCAEGGASTDNAAYRGMERSVAATNGRAAETVPVAVPSLPAYCWLGG